MTTLYLQRCEVSDPGVWKEATGTDVSVGDPEFRLLDDPERPGMSADFLSQSDALAWARQNEHDVVFLLPWRFYERA